MFMRDHPFVAGLIVGLFAILLLILVGLLFYPELVYIYRVADRYITEMGK